MLGRLRMLRRGASLCVGDMSRNKRVSTNYVSSERNSSHKVAVPVGVGICWNNDLVVFRDLHDCPPEMSGLFGKLSGSSA